MGGSLRQRTVSTRPLRGPAAIRSLARTETALKQKERKQKTWVEDVSKHVLSRCEDTEERFF